MKIKRFLAIILAIVMIISTMSIPSFAIDDIDNSISESSDTTNITDEQESSEESTEESSEEFSEESSEESSEEFYEEFNLENDLPADDVVATVNDDEYATIQEAINAAQANDTIVFCDDVNENVTIDKNITLDGADKQYTGTMTISDNKTVTIANVNFVKGSITEEKGTHGKLTITNCDFDDSDKSTNYAITVRGSDNVVIEDCTATGYNYGMLYIPSSVANISVKNVEVINSTVAFNISYSGDGRFENVELTNVTYGLHVQNYGARTFTLTGCEFDCGSPVYVQKKGTAYVTFKFEGNNDFGTEEFTDPLNEYAILKLANADATLTACSDLNVTTDVEGGVVEYVDDTYSVKCLKGQGTQEKPYLIENLNDLIFFRNNVNAGNTYEGKYVLLTSDIDLKGYKETNINHEGNNVSSSTFRPIADKASGVAFKGTFDGGDHTISNLYISGWDINYHWDSYGQAALFGTIENATVMNLTVEGFEIQVEGGDVAAIAGHAKGECTFENITVTDSKIATYNNGCAGIVAWTEDGDYTFKNINITDSVVLAGLWGSFDSSIGGVVSQAEPGAAYNFENVDIACRLDVYNDCTASYDYYNYRMCGMIIGRLEETITVDGKAYPDMSKYDITCKDVTVTMGEWANYHYCEPTPGYNNGRGMRVEPGYAYDGLPADYDHSQCTTNHMTVMPFTSLFGGKQLGVAGNTKEDLAKLGFFDGEKNKEEDIVVIDYSLPARSVAEVEGEYFDDLQKAIDAAEDGDTITVINDIENAQNVTITNKTVIIDLDGHTVNGTILPSTGDITIKNGSIVSKNTDNSAIEINSGKLTLTDVNIEGARHAVRIDGAVEAVIDGGEYKLIPTAGKTQHAFNISGAANVTFVDGTFTGPKGTSADSGAAVNVQSGATATILGGTYTGGKVNTLANKGTLTISGGTFDQDPTAYVAEGARAIEDKGNGYWVVLPAGVHSIELSVDNSEKTYYFEDTITLDVTVNGGAYAVSDWTLTYDTEKLEYIGTVQLDGDSKAPVVNETSGTITEENYSNKIGGDLFADGSKVTYTFKVKAPVEDTTALFKITAATVDTVLTSAYGKTDVNTPELTVNIKLREIVEITKADNGTEFTDEPYVFTHDEKDHVITVDAEDIDGETITYKLDGTSVDEVKINAAGTYVVEYTITKAGYDTVTDTITITVEEAEFTNVIVKDGDDTTITVDPYNFAFDNTDHVITIDADGVDGESIVYTLNGEEVAAISLKAVGTYEIGYTITKDSYTTYTGTLKVVITNPEFVIETSVYTLNDHTLVMLYTTADGMYPKLGSDAMFDITAAGYEYQENEDSTPVPYAKVYGIVLPKAEAADLEALRASITFSTKKPFVIDPYDNDVTFDSQVNSRDIVIAVNVYNDYEDIHGKYDMMSRILKSDVTGDKKVDIADVTAIEAEIYG